MKGNEIRRPAAPAVPAVAEKPGNTLTLSADPAEMAKQAKDLHLYTIGGTVIGRVAEALDLVKSPDQGVARVVAEAFLTELIRSIKPRDAVEEMLVIQMALVNQRIANLSLKAADQELTKNVAVVNHALDQACNTFRKQMLALAEYRRPPRTKVFAPIRNANVARQQVVQVQNAESKDFTDGFAANELGLQHDRPPPLPLIGGGVGVPAELGAAAPAVGAEYGSADGGGQGAVAAERADARRVQRRPPRGASRDERGHRPNAQRRRSAS